MALAVERGYFRRRRNRMRMAASANSTDPKKNSEVGSDIGEAGRWQHNRRANARCKNWKTTCLKGVGKDAQIQAFVSVSPDFTESSHEGRGLGRGPRHRIGHNRAAGDVSQKGK